MAITFNMNTQKAIESVLWIIQNGEPNMYNIWKVLFSAEKYHLNKYGRPITGDKYIAMEFGTVPSWLYNASKIQSRGLGFYRENNSLCAERPADTNYFSDTDIEALKFGLNEYAGLDFNAVKEKNHQEACWIKNYENRGDSDSAIIPFEDIIEEDWLRQDLTTLSRNMVL